MNRVRLIVNGDDFGLTRGINQGITEAAATGILTSTSVMVSRPYAAGINEFHARFPNVGIGLHVDFSKELLAKAKTGENVSISEIKSEIESQIHLFKTITGYDPDHLDFHKVAVRQTEVFASDEVRLFRKPVMEVAEQYKIPWRGMPGLIIIDSFHGAVYDSVSHKKTGTDLGKISVAALKRILGELDAGDYEMMTHPGFIDEEMTSSYSSERD